MKRRSLLRQLIISHLLLAMVVMGIIWATFILERNRTISGLISDRWAGALVLAQQNSTAALPAGLQAVAPPARRQPLLQYAPRSWMLKSALRQRGVQVGNIQISAGHLDELWVEILPPHSSPRWFVVPAPLLDDAPRGRLLLAMLLSLLTVAALSGWNVRRMIRPLQQIETAVRGQQRVGELPPNTAQEIGLIAHAYNQLQDEQTKQTAERNLLLAGVSHDLRSPLARIRTAAALLPDTPETASKAAMIARNVDVADQLIGSFMDYVRVGSEPLQTAVALLPVWETLQSLYRDTPSVQFAELTPAVSTSHLQQASTTLLVRALQNLIDNGIRHGEAPILVSASLCGEELHLTVKDHGKGIAVEEEDTLWQAFARGDSSRHQPGTGLGLAIVRQIANRFGATIITGHLPDGWYCQLQLPVTNPPVSD